MRVDEITRPKTRIDGTEAMKRLGWKVIGYGAFADVYEKPGVNYVVKLFTETDTSYMKFIKMVLANPNPHFPKFYGKPVPLSISNERRSDILPSVKDRYSAETGLIAIRMERLQEFFSSHSGDAAALSEADPETSLFRKFITYYISNQTHHDHVSPETRAALAEAIDEEYGADMLRALESIGKMMMENPEISLDLYETNVMMRGSTIVITDPVA